MPIELFSHVITTLYPLRVTAYLDPGSGSFLIQLLIGALVGAGFIIKAYWRKIKGLFNRSSSAEDIQNPDDDQPE